MQRVRGAGDRADLSGADDGAQSGLHDRRSDRRALLVHGRATRRTARDKRHRAARAVRVPKRRARARLPASAVGRPAAARDDRDALACDPKCSSPTSRRPRSTSPSRRRSSSCCATCSAARPLAAAHHARPRRRRRDGRPRGRDVRRPDRRRGTGRGPVRCAGASLHARACWRRFPAARRARGLAAIPDGANPAARCRRGAVSRRAARRVRAVPDRASRHHRLRRRANGEVLPARPAMEPAVAGLKPGATRRCTPGGHRRREAGLHGAARGPHLVKEFTARGGLFRAPRRPRGGRRELSDRGGRDVRPGRRVRERQDDDRALHPAADRADVGRGGVQAARTCCASIASGCAWRAATCRSSFRIRIRRSTRACASATSSRSR